MAGDARAAAEQQLVAFEGRGAVEVGVADTGLTEQVLGNEAAQIHRLLILTEPLHQLFAAHTDDTGGHHRLDRGQCGVALALQLFALAVLHHLALALAELA